MTSGRIFEGCWEANMPHGQVKETTDDGDVYVGEFVQGKRCGTGVLTLKTGKIYEGQFVDNMPSGQGKLTVPGELYYIGNFTPRGDKFAIEGKIVYEDGREVEGSWGDVDN